MTAAPLSDPPAQNDSDDADRALLGAIRERLEAAENAFDAEPVIAVMAEDVALMVPNEPVHEGKRECAAFLRRTLAEQHEWFERHITYSSDEVAVWEQVAIDRGCFAFTVIARHDGSRTDATGKYLWLYGRASNGAWALRRAIMSLDDPPER